MSEINFENVKEDDDSESFKPLLDKHRPWSFNDSDSFSLELSRKRDKPDHELIKEEAKDEEEEKDTKRSRKSG